jgi:chromosome segregation ATPase
MHQQQDQSSQADVASEEHWADFVKKKAALEVTLAGLNKSLLDAKNKIAELGKNNKELSIKIDQLTKEKQRLSESIKFKERTLRVMSMDLVSEREERSVAVKEVGKLRGENIGLKRELVLANKEQMKLQNDFKSTLNRKDALERRIMEAENVLREKSLAFEELQGRLRQAIAGGRKIIASESAAVELPPIVVKPTIPGLGGIRGEIIAVNREENFVVIDAGEASGLRPGAILKTMRGNREIATLEVIETRREISAADVVETLGGFYLQEGDVVISR